MKTLNLTSLEASDIKFEVSNFPDGQQDIKITSLSVKEELDWTKVLSLHPVEIRSRFKSFRDLELILCATKALKRLGVEEIHLFIPYILGARSDRKFVKGGTSYLVDVVAPVINAQHYKTVTTLDAHSDVAAACIERLEVKDNEELVAFALYDLYPTTWDTTKDNFVVVSPDGGSLKKIYHVVDHMSIGGDIVICSKYRDHEGNLSRVEVPVKDSQVGKDFIIIDDICDGGATFINIAKELKKQFVTGKIYLIVTHGIFSKGFGELAKYFDGIYTTNSYQDLLPDTKSFVKQLNVY